jgi:hypothetical protein
MLVPGNPGRTCSAGRAGKERQPFENRALLMASVSAPANKPASSMPTTLRCHRDPKPGERVARLANMELVFEYHVVSIVRPVAQKTAGAGGIGDRPVAPTLRPLLPSGVLRAGTAVSVDDADLPLLLALAGGATDGPWAAVALPDLGALAAADAGLDLRAGLWVDRPGRDWPQIVAVLLETVPLVLLRPLGRLADRSVRRLASLQRRSGAVLLVAGPWPGAHSRLRVTESAWEGVGTGHGVLRRRRVTVAASGRRESAAGRSATMWLPGPKGAPLPLTTGAKSVAEPVFEGLSGVG